MAARAQKIQVAIAPREKAINRPGVHAKTRTSKLKTSKNYKKPYRGQGR